MTVLRIGIDLGGTKVAGVALDPAGRELARRRAPTPRGDYDATLRVIADLVAALEAEVGSHGTVGVGIPGVVSGVTGTVKNANSTWLNGRALDRDLAVRLGREVRVANDANCLAVSEATDGAGAGAALVFAVILGTGVGGGVAFDGRVVAGRNGVAGEWGHTPLPWPGDDERPGPSCYCGRRGCVETFASGPGIAADHARVTGQQRRAEEISDAAAAGDSGAVATLQRAADRLARGLAVVVDVTDPEVIVLAGGVSEAPGLAEQVEAALPSYVFGGECATPVRRAVHGPTSGMRGAAWLWGR